MYLCRFYHFVYVHGNIDGWDGQKTMAQVCRQTQDEERKGESREIKLRTKKKKKNENGNEWINFTEKIDILSSHNNRYFIKSIIISRNVGMN